MESEKETVEEIITNIADSDILTESELKLLITLINDEIIKTPIINITQLQHSSQEGPLIPKPKIKYRYLVLSGGSTRGIAHIGAIWKLINEGLLDLTEIKGLACTSAGSMIGTFIVLGISIEKIWEFILSIDFRKLVSPNFLLFPTKCGIETGEFFHNLFEEILTKTTHIKYINFKQLYELTHIEYTVVGSCLTTKTAIYYNHINTPNFQVSLALRISTCLPGFFMPIVIDGKTYIDGSITDCYPIEIFDDHLEETIGIIICNDYNTNYEYPEEYCMALVNLFMYMCYKKDQNKYKENTIYVNKNISDISMFDFDLDLDKKNRIYNAGISASEDFIDNLNK